MIYIKIYVIIQLKNITHVKTNSIITLNNIELSSDKMDDVCYRLIKLRKSYNYTKKELSEYLDCDEERLCRNPLSY